MAMKRGDLVVCAAPGDYGKPRPAVVVQSDIFNPTHPSVVVCLITTHLTDAPAFRVPLPPGRTTGLKQASQVMIDKAVTLPKEKIGQWIGSLTEAQLQLVDAALTLFLGLSDAESLAADSKLQ